MPLQNRFVTQIMVLVALAAPLIGAVSLPARADDSLLCRPAENHQVCIVSIKRSAKNFWEYRVQLKIDGQIRPKERYDCRRSLLPSPADEQPSTQALRELVCSSI